MPFWVYFPCILIYEICFIFMLITCVEMEILLFITDISTGYKKCTHTHTHTHTHNPETKCFLRDLEFCSCTI